MSKNSNKDKKGIVLSIFLIQLIIGVFISSFIETDIILQDGFFLYITIKAVMMLCGMLSTMLIISIYFFLLLKTFLKGNISFRYSTYNLIRYVLNFYEFSVIVLAIISVFSIHSVDFVQISKYLRPIIMSVLLYISVLPKFEIDTYKKNIITVLFCIFLVIFVK